MSFPTVTALVVTESNTAYLGRTLSALGNQTLTPNRTCIVDWAARPLPQSQELADLGVEYLHVGTSANLGQALQRAFTVDPTLLEADWLWILHDDSAPQTGCLRALIEPAIMGRSTGIVGPKQVGWTDSKHLIEVGIRASRSGRRLDYISPDEIDQGQYDTVDDVLAVGTAGMLISTRCYQTVGGFDPALGPFGDGLEIGRRAHLAGYRVVIAPDAKIAHARGAYRSIRAELTEPNISASFKARRISQLYNAMLAHTPAALVVMLVTLPLITVGRSLVRLLLQRPDLAGAELASMVGAYRKLGAVKAGRTRVNRVRRVPFQVLHQLEVPNRAITKAKRSLARKEKTRRPTQILEPVAGRLLRQHERLVRLVALAGSIIIATAFAIPERKLTGPLTGAAWARLPRTWGQLWDAAWAGRVPGPLGQNQASDPLLNLWVILTAPLSAPFSITPTTVMTAAWYLAPALTWATMFFSAGALTRRIPWRVAFASIWVVQPAFLLAWSQGRIGALIAHLAAPLTLWGWFQVAQLSATTEIRGAGDPIKIRTINYPTSAAAVAAASLIATSTAAPWTIAAATCVVIALIMASPRHWRVLIATLIPATIILLPTWIAAAELPTRRSLRLFLADSGASLAVPTATTWQTVLGLPTNTDGLPAGQLPTLPISELNWWWYLPATVTLVGAVIAAAKIQRHLIRTRVAILAATCGFIVAVVATRTAVDVADRFVGAWSGIALSTAQLALIIAWAGAIRPLVLEEPARSYAARRRLERAAQRRRRRHGETNAPDQTALTARSERLWQPLSRAGWVATMTVSVLSLIHFLPGALNGTDTVRSQQGFFTPAASLEAQSNERAARLLVLDVTPSLLQIALRQSDGVEIAQSSPRLRLQRVLDVQATRTSTTYNYLARPDSASSELTQLVANLLLNPNANMDRQLSRFAIDEIALTPTTGSAHEDAIAALEGNPSLASAGEADIGKLWRVRPWGEQTWAALITDGQRRIHVPSDPYGAINIPLEQLEGYSQLQVDPDQPAQLELSQPYDGNWRATVNGEELPSQANGWQQTFRLTQATGTLRVVWAAAWLPLWWIGSAISVIAITVAAVPIRRRERADVA